MNIGLMQLTNVKIPSKANPIMSTTYQNITKRTQAFDDVFNGILSSKETTKSYEKTSPDEVDLDELEDELETDSVEELLDLLGISHDDGLLMLQVGDEGRAVAIDEIVNLEDLLAMLNMDQQQLMETFQSLGGDQLDDIWSLFNFVNEQAPNVISQLTSALQGEHNITPKEAQQFLEFLKLAQLIGKNSDLLGDQADQLGQIKELLQSLMKEVQISQTTQTTRKASVQGFQQVVEQKEVSNVSVNGSVNQTTITTTKTVTITLPETGKSAQSEALAKEIQSLLNRSQIAKAQGTMKLLLKLNPDHLGSIRIELLQKDGVLTARLLASTSIGKELLDSEIHQLKSAFAQANIQIERIDVAQSLQQTDRNFRDQSMFSNLFKQQQEQDDTEQNETEDDESILFSDYLKNEEV